MKSKLRPESNAKVVITAPPFKEKLFLIKIVRLK
jgi:hypothetical protein